jgi:hypothetical protein
MAVEIGGSAVTKVYSEHNLKIKTKGLTEEGKAELLTRADLVSNHLIMDLLKRYPLMNVRCKYSNLTIFIGNHRRKVRTVVRR